MSLAAVLRRPRGLGLRAPGLAGPELALVAFADWLFWHRAVGLSLPLFCIAVAAVAARLRPARRGPARGAVATLLLAALAPAVERPTALSTAFAVAGTLLSLRLGVPHDAHGWPGRLGAAVRDLLAGPRQFVRDVLRQRRLLDRRRGRSAERPPPWLAWIVPLALTAVFAALLAGANPLIAGWIAGLTVPSLDDVLRGLPRSLFWLLVLVKLWPLIRRRRVRSRTPTPPRPVARTDDARELDRLTALLLSPAAVLRVLVLLDLLLGLQLGLDGAYLWGGLALPDGLTYAAYAHRGAYPLLATALLAGAVALLIRRPGAPPPPGAAAALLLLFLGENVILVVSAMERLCLSVAAYGLTEWRVAAFAWMGLVALGLGLIAATGALRRDGRWLLRANVLAALAVLYGWCVLDPPRVVADYDVAHCAELKGEGPPLDIGMVGGLGPDALPALDRYLLGFRSDAQRGAASDWRHQLAREVRAGMADWRGWSLAGWRLARYLDRSGVAEPAAPPAAAADDDDP